MNQDFKHSYKDSSLEVTLEAQNDEHSWANIQDLELQSVPGKGTTVRFRLPFSEKRVHLLEAKASGEES